MPIADMTGAAQNAMEAARYAGALGRQRNEQIVSGVSQLGEAAGDAIHKKKFKDQLVQSGFSEAEAQSLVEAGPAAAATAMLQRKRDELQRQRDEAQTNLTREGWNREDARSGIIGGQYDPTQDPGVGRTAAEEGIRTQSALDIYGGKQGMDMAAGVGDFAPPKPPPHVETPEEAAAKAGAVEAARLGEQKKLGIGDFAPPKPEKPAKTTAEIEAEARAKRRGSLSAEAEFPKPAATWTGRESAAAALVRGDIARREAALEELRSYVEPGKQPDGDLKTQIDAIEKEITDLRAKHARLTGDAGAAAGPTPEEPTPADIEKAKAMGLTWDPATRTFR